MKSYAIQTILTAIIILSLVFTVGYLLLKVLELGIEMEEIRQCLELQHQSEYRGFYLTQYQNDMCEAHGVIINAPVY